MNIIILALLLSLHTGLCVAFGFAISAYFLRKSIDKFLQLIQTKEYFEGLVRKELRENNMR